MSRKLILASSSPRRRWILEKFGYEFEVVSPTIDEKIYRVEDCISAAEEKAKSIKRVGIILASDTVVVLENKILGKPKNSKEAIEFLQKLSGKWHEVFTGYAIISNETIIKKLVKTRVKFFELSNTELNLILQNDHLLDKAGAYGIQDFAGLFVEEIAGSYYNVVGLPIEYIYWDLKSLGILPTRASDSNKV